MQLDQKTFQDSFHGTTLVIIRSWKHVNEMWPSCFPKMCHRLTRLHRFEALHAILEENCFSIFLNTGPIIFIFESKDIPNLKIESPSCS